MQRAHVRVLLESSQARHVLGWCCFFFVCEPIFENTHESLRLSPVALSLWRQKSFGEVKKEKELSDKILN
jgi:hypothetical protein